MPCLDLEGPQLWPRNLAMSRYRVLDMCSGVDSLYRTRLRTCGKRLRTDFGVIGLLLRGQMMKVVFAEVEILAVFLESGAEDRQHATCVARNALVGIFSSCDNLEVA